MRRFFAIILAVLFFVSLLGCSREISEEDYRKAIWERRDAGEPLLTHEEEEFLEEWDLRYDHETEALYDKSSNLQRGSYPVLLDKENNLVGYNTSGIMKVFDMKEKNVVKFSLDVHYSGSWENRLTTSENETVVRTENGFEVWEFGRKTTIEGAYVGEFRQDGWAYLQEDTLYIFKNGENRFVSDNVETVEAEGWYISKEFPYQMVFTKKDGTKDYFADGKVFPYPPSYR